MTAERFKPKEQKKALGKIASVLLADDEPNVLFTFRAVLEEAGYEVLPAPSFSEARDALKSTEVDAIIAAAGLEKGELGLALAREAKSLSSPPAVLMYSGEPDVAKLRAALSARVDYFAFQPIDLEEIKTALFRLVARRSDRVRPDA